MILTEATRQAWSTWLYAARLDLMASQVRWMREHNTRNTDLDESHANLSEMLAALREPEISAHRPSDLADMRDKLREEIANTGDT